MSNELKLKYIGGSTWEAKRDYYNYNTGIIGIPYLKKGSGIYIKKKNRGKFTEYCGGEVTDECILRAKKSKNPKLRKRATFAANSRRWSKKQLGGLINYFNNIIGL